MCCSYTSKFIHTLYPSLFEILFKKNCFAARKCALGEREHVCLMMWVPFQVPHRPGNATVINVCLCPPRLQRDGKEMECESACVSVLCWRPVFNKRKQKLAQWFNRLKVESWPCLCSGSTNFFLIVFFSVVDIISLTTNHRLEARQTREHSSTEKKSIRQSGESSREPFDLFVFWVHSVVSH